MNRVKRILFAAVVGAVAAGGLLLPSAPTTADAYRPCGTCPPDWFNATHL